MSDGQIRRDLRRLLPEFSAAIEEFRATFDDLRDPPPNITYGEAILTTIAPLVTTYVEAIRSRLDDLDEPELAELHRLVSRVVDQRRKAQQSYARSGPGKRRPR